MQISNDLSKQYMQILAQLKRERAECYTQKEVSVILKTSLRKYIDFENGKQFDFCLLDQLAGLLCKNLNISL